MSMQLDFEPHSWYMGFAIKQNDRHDARNNIAVYEWDAFIDNGNTYQIDEVNARTLSDLKYRIREYYMRKSGNDLSKVPARLVRQLALHHVRTAVPL